MPHVRFAMFYEYNTITATFNTGAGFTTFDYQVDSADDPEPLGALLYSVWKPLFVDALALSAVLLGWQLYDLQANDFPNAIAENQDDSTRCTSIGSLPSQNCVVIKRHDGGIGRSHHGRIFLSPVAVAGLQLFGNGDLVDTTYAPYVAIAEQMKTPLVHADYGHIVPVIWHRADSTATKVVSTSVQEILCCRRTKRTWRFDDVVQS